MAIDSSQLEELRLLIVTESQQANVDMANLARGLRLLSKSSGETVADLAKVLKNLDDMDKGTKTLITDAVKLSASWDKVTSAIQKAELAQDKIAKKNTLAQANAKVSGIFDSGVGDSKFSGSVSAEKARVSANRVASNVVNTQGMLFSPEVIDKSTQALAKNAKALQSIEPASKSAASGLFSLRNIIRTALGTMEAMAIFLIAKFVGDALKKTIESVSQLEQAFFKLSIAEKSISKAGVDISPKQLQDIANEIVNTYETVSKIGALKMISNLAVLTKDLKLTSVEYAKLAKAIPLVAQQAGVTIDSATEQVITGLTKSGRGWADLGITVDAAIIRQAAVTDGLVASAEAYDALTAEQKQQVEVQALINILQKNTVENLGEQDNYLKTIQGSATKVTVAWENLTTSMGEISRPVIIQGLQVIGSWLVSTNEYLEANRQSWGEWSGNVSAAIIIVSGVWKAMQKLMLGGGIDVEGLKQTFALAEKAKQDALDIANSLGKLPNDTPTSSPTVGDGADISSDLAEALDKMNKEILDANIKLEQDLQDVTIDLERKRADIALEYAKKRADIEKDYADKVIDINRSYEDKLYDQKRKEEEGNQKARNDELEREREFQNKMQEMKENFLMDLEDALHARDARQILKLIKNYNLEKLQAERKHKLDKENAKQDEKLRKETLAREREDLERERKRKLEDAQREYADKIAKLAADQKAEEDAARLEALRKIEDLNKNNADRLAVIAANLVAEYNLTQEGLNAILSLYQKYYSDITAIYSAMQSMMAGSGGLGGGTGGGNTGGGSGQVPIGSEDKAPTFNSLSASSLQSMATFSTVNRNPKTMGNAFTSLGGAGRDGGGNVQIELLLSPDLESRIVKNTLTKTGQIFTKVQRSKG